MNNRYQRVFIFWELVSPGLAIARFRSIPFNVNVNVVHGLTLQTEPTAKDAFYNKLQGLDNRIPEPSIVPVTGEWNFHTGPADECIRHMLGRLDLGK